VGKGPAPEWRRRKEPVLDDYLRASIAGVNGQHDVATGWYQVLHIRGIKTRDEAREVVRALYRSARHVGVSVAQKTLPQPDGSHVVEFAAVNKDHARAYVAQHYGDRLPYNPHTRIKE
jgi:hypothetical protein